jgi:hypothetical protein
MQTQAAEIRRQHARIWRLNEITALQSLANMRRAGNMVGAQLMRALIRERREHGLAAGFRVP